MEMYNKQEKRWLNLDVKVRTTIMMTTLSSIFEKENSLDDEGMCLMTHIIKSHSETSIDNAGTLDADSSQAVAESNIEWNATSAY
uniref:Uncharacterized protein n=1 Tax=Lactuca sativa TaxID=4236 RepID=A0A9R1VTF9_LACSA|nr:hypothetical protein LSAT_V11C400180620 [Lactuca sativa]